MEFLGRTRCLIEVLELSEVPLGSHSLKDQRDNRSDRHQKVNVSRTGLVSGISGDFLASAAFSFQALRSVSVDFIEWRAHVYPNPTYYVSIALRFQVRLLCCPVVSCPVASWQVTPLCCSV